MVQTEQTELLMCPQRVCLCVWVMYSNKDIQACSKAVTDCNEPVWCFHPNNKLNFWSAKKFDTCWN